MKKLSLVLLLFVGTNVFASPGKTSLKHLNSKKVVKAQYYRTSCDGVTFTYQAGSTAEAVAIASRYCGGGVIEILG